MSEPNNEDRVGEFATGSVIPPHLRAPVLAAREVWRHCWPGMKLDGSADLIVLALDRAGYLRTRPARKRGGA